MIKMKTPYPLVWLVVLFSFSCNIQAEINEIEDDVNSAYAIVRAQENNRVEQLLMDYAQGSEGADLADKGPDAYERLNIAFMTDSHIDLGPVPKESVRNVKDAIDFCNNSEVPISAIIHGGDLVTQIKSTKQEHIAHLNEYFNMGWEAKMPLLYTKGNHDINTINVSPSQMLSDKDWSDVWYDRAEKEYGIVRHLLPNGQKSGYYYYDLEKWKVRIISVDCFDLDYTKTNERGDII